MTSFQSPPAEHQLDLDLSELEDAPKLFRDRYGILTNDVAVSRDGPERGV